MSDSPEFRKIIESECPEPLSSAQIDLLVRFREEVLKENEIQNLTRLLSPRDFYEGHVLDVIHLKKSGFLSFPCLDLGSGMGVPGLIYALLYGGEWVVCDSETKKAEFMARMIDLFRLDKVSAASVRAEELLNTHSFSSIVSRAVGPVSRIYAWIGKSSTWNKLVLLKGPKWSDEWSDFQKTSQRNRLKLSQQYSYEVGAEKKSRILIQLSR